MGLYVLAPNGSVERYPYNAVDLRIANPGTSFPQNPTDELLAEWGVFPVAPTPQPAFDPATEELTEGQPAMVQGVWTQTWLVRSLTPEEIEERRIASVPRVVSMRQARLALLAAGLLDDVEAAIAAGPQAARIEWEYATEVQRDYGLVLQLAPALGLTDRQLDDLFVAAASL